jgi:pyruvate-formate lyase-activating enzyme
MDELTNIYHIAYSPKEKQAYLHFWGCNYNCRGCLCKKEIYDFMLKENMAVHLEEPKGIAKPPQKFLRYGEVIKILEKLDVKWVLLEGQEASLDPSYPRLTEELHSKLGTHNVLLTNAYKLPPLKDTDQVGVSLKAYSEGLHKHYTGKSKQSAFDNFIRLYQSGVELSAETVLIPDYVDTTEIEQIAKFIASVNNNIRFQIDAYFKVADNPWRRPATEEMDEAVFVARKYLSNVYCYRGDENQLYDVFRAY